MSLLLQDSAAGGECGEAGARGPAAAAGLLTGTPKAEHAEAQACPTPNTFLLTILFMCGWVEDKFADRHAPGGACQGAGAPCALAWPCSSMHINLVHAFARRYCWRGVSFEGVYGQCRSRGNMRYRLWWRFTHPSGLQEASWCRML